MHSSKLINILRCFDRKSLRRLEKFIQHPFFVEVKQKGKVLILFQLIKKYHPVFDNRALEKERAVAVVFSGELHTAKKLDKIMTRLLKVVRAFIAYEYIDPRRKNIQQLLAEAKFYQEQSLDNYFLQSIQQLQAMQKKRRYQEKEYFYTAFLINEQTAEFYTFYNKRKGDLNLPETHQSLDIFYLIAKLEYACSALAQGSYQDSPKMRQSLQLIETLASIIEQEFSPKVPVIALYYQIFVLLKQGDGEDTEEHFRTIISKSIELLPFKQLISVQAIYRSYCIREYNRGNQMSLDYLFELYKEHLNNGYLSRRGGLQPSLIKNLVTLGIKQEAYDWVRQFLQEYKDKIVGTTHPKEVYYFNLANYFFAIKEYDKVLDSLEWYKEDNFYKIAARRLELKVYYEQNSPLLESKMDAFKVYIFRLSKQILPKMHQQGNNNFIDFLRQINSLNYSNNKGKIDRLISKLKNRKVLMEKDWLLIKLTDLKMRT